MEKGLAPDDIRTGKDASIPIHEHRQIRHAMLKIRYTEFGLTGTILGGMQITLCCPLSEA